MANAKCFLPRYLVINSRGDSDHFHEFIGVMATEGWLNGAEYWCSVPTDRTVTRGCRRGFQREAVFVYDIYNSSIQPDEAGILIAEVLRWIQLNTAAKCEYALTSLPPTVYPWDELEDKMLGIEPGMFGTDDDEPKHYNLPSSRNDEQADGSMMFCNGKIVDDDDVDPDEDEFF